MTVDLKKRTRTLQPRTEHPGRDFINRGFGMIQVPHKDWQPRIEATKQVLSMIKGGKLPHPSEELQQNLSMVKGMFSRIYVGDCYDWFTTSIFLGHPSGDLSKVLSEQLAMIKGALRVQDPELFQNCVARIKVENGVDMLENYLDMAVRSAHPVREEGWAYILWSSSEKDVVHVGAAGGEVEDVIERLNAENPRHHPYGVLAAWLVHDPVEAYNDVRNALDRYSLGDGFFRVELGVARDAVDKALKNTENFALSPWHDYDPKGNAPAQSATGMKMVA